MGREAHAGSRRVRDPRARISRRRLAAEHIACVYRTCAGGDSMTNCMAVRDRNMVTITPMRSARADWGKAKIT